MQKLLALFLLLGLCGSVQSQTKINPYVLEGLQRCRRPQQTFWRETGSAALYCAGGLALDAYSTQKFLSMPCTVMHYDVSMLGDPPRVEVCRYSEANPIARPLVLRGWAGQTVASGLIGFGGTTLVSYYVHRRGWHRYERLPYYIVGAASIFCGVVNLNTRGINHLF